MMEVEMMLMTQVMCVCNDDDSAQIHGLEKEKKGLVENIYIGAHYACMKPERFAYWQWTRWGGREGGSLQAHGKITKHKSCWSCNC